jgi:hypothetical protein
MSSKGIPRIPSIFLSTKLALSVEGRGEEIDRVVQESAHIL